MDKKYREFFDKCDIHIEKQGTMPDTRSPGDITRPDSIPFRTGKESKVRTTDYTINFGPYSCYEYHMIMPDTYYVSVHGKPFEFIVAYGLSHALKCKRNIINGKIIGYTNLEDEYDDSSDKYISFDVVNSKGHNSFMMSLRAGNPEAVMMSEKKFSKIARNFIDSNVST